MVERRLSCARNHLKVAGIGLVLLATAVGAAQDFKLGVTYVCNGERQYVESCNIRDLSDTATCQVVHPEQDHSTTVLWPIRARRAAR